MFTLTEVEGLMAFDVEILTRHFSVVQLSGRLQWQNLGGDEL